MAVHAHGWLMLHAGVVPQWDLATTLRLAGELERALRDSPPREFLGAMFGNEPRALERSAQRRPSACASPSTSLTRIRFVSADGTLEFATKDGAARRAPGPHRLVRRARAPHRRHADRLRPLVDARPARPSRPARPRHRLRLGRAAERRAPRRGRPAHAGAGRLRRTATGLNGGSAPAGTAHPVAPPGRTDPLPPGTGATCRPALDRAAPSAPCLWCARRAARSASEPRSCPACKARSPSGSSASAPSGCSWATPARPRRVGRAVGGVTVTDCGPWSGQFQLRYFGPRPLVEDDSQRPIESRIAPGGAALEDIHFHPVEPRRVRLTLSANFRGARRHPSAWTRP